MMLSFEVWATAIVLSAAATVSPSPGAVEASVGVPQSVLDKGGSDTVAAELLDWTPEEAIPRDLRAAATSSPEETRLFVLLASGVRTLKCIGKDTTTVIRTKATLYARPGERLGNLASQPLVGDFERPLKAVGIVQEDFSASNQDQPTHFWELRLFKPGVDEAYINSVFGGAVRGGPADILQNPDIGSAVREALFDDNSAVRGEFIPVGDGDAPGPDQGPAVFLAVPPDVHPAATMIPQHPGIRRRSQSILRNSVGMMNNVRHVIRLGEGISATSSGSSSSSSTLQCNPKNDDLIEVHYSAQLHFFGVQQDQFKRHRRKRRDEM